MEDTHYTDADHPTATYVFGVVLLSLQVLVTFVSAIALLTSVTQYKEIVAVFGFLTGLLLLAEAVWLYYRDRAEHDFAHSNGDDPDDTGASDEWDTPLSLGAFGLALLFISNRALLPPYPLSFNASLSFNATIPIEYAVTTGRALGIAIVFGYAIVLLYRSIDPL